MSTHWARHSDAIEDAREELNTALISRAVMWATSTNQPEATELYAALAEVFESQGNRNASSCAVNRAVEIVLDAYLEDQQRRAAA